MTLLRRFTRTTGSGDFIPEVDGLRFIAIGAVILHHVTSSYLTTTGRFGVVRLPGQWWQVMPQSTAVTIGYSGYFGVNLFFVISGFILALPFVRSYRQGTTRPHLGSYYLRRVVRLEPPYIAGMLIAFLVILATNVGWRNFIPHLLATLMYLHGPVYGQASWINGVAWSLEVEVQFYLVMPLLALIFAVRPVLLRRLLLIGGIVLGAMLAMVVAQGNLHPRLKLSLLNYLQFFLAGFLLADVYQARENETHRREWLWDAVALLSGLALFVILTRRYDLFPLTPFLVVLLYAGLFKGRIGHAFITNPSVVVIGGMCYTIYLYHVLVIHALEPWTLAIADAGRSMGVELFLQSAALVPPILLVSAISFLLVEKPFMNLSRQVNRRYRAMRSTASGMPLAQTVSES